MKGWLAKGVVAGVVTFAIIKIGEKMLSKQKNNVTATMGVRG